MNSKNLTENQEQTLPLKVDKTNDDILLSSPKVEKIKKETAPFDLGLTEDDGSFIETAPDEKEESQTDFYAYQTSLFVATNLGYLPVAGTMLSTTFFEPNKDECSHPNFSSLLVEWNEHCKDSLWQTTISSTIMLGACFGAFLSGFFADRFGRKPVVIGCMAVICISNALIAGFGHILPLFTAILFGIAGSASGGYMVVNLVLMVENLLHSNSRLLVVSLNGWSIAMCYVALIAHLTKHWKSYHLVNSIVAVFLSILLHCISLESVRWLKQHNKFRKADKIQTRINSRNSKVNELLPRSLQSLEKIEKRPPSLDATAALAEKKRKKYTYLDLFRYPSVRKPLMALFYCFFTSSLVSFGFYFNIDFLPGSRFLNLALMGIFKFVLGFIPYAVSWCLGRRPIIIASVIVATMSAWLLIGISMGMNSTNHMAITFLGLLVTASMDPTWKIIHLYSAELFPTVVRNMARAFCNVGARIGSLAAPIIVFTRHWFPQTPIIIFASLLTIQLLIVLLYFPETKGKPLPDEITENRGDIKRLNRNEEDGSNL